MDKAPKQLLLAFVASFLLGAAGPIVRQTTGVKGSGSYPVFAAVAVMIVYLFLNRKSPFALGLALTMSIAGITLGGGTGFLVTGLANDSGPLVMRGLKWLLIGAVSGGLLLWTLSWEQRLAADEGTRDVFIPDLSREDVVALSEDERDEYLAKANESLTNLRAELETLEQRSRKSLVLAGALIILGLAVVIGSFLSKQLPGLS